MLSLVMNEYNLLMGTRAYLPLVSGQLLASAFQHQEIRDAYRVAPLAFGHYDLKTILDRYPAHVDVAAFSVALWNEQLSLAVARAIRPRWPEALIVFGGWQIPYDGRAYLRRYPFINLTTRGEGERTFTEILRARLAGRSYHTVPGLTVGDVRTPDGTGPKDLDEFPSPYLTGWYDALLHEYPDVEWQAILEGDRGCPFSCSFCGWGSPLNTKYRFFSVPRVEAILHWMADHRIRYVFNANSNFGMMPHDAEIVNLLVRVKRETGYPEKFRTCWGKNSNQKIYALVKQLHDAGLDKGLTLSMQSQHPATLKAIHRTNIRLDDYHALQAQATRDRVPIYTELILGLPEETEASWREGLRLAMAGGPHHTLFIYHCEILPNTAMADPAYLAQYGLLTQRVPLQAIHTTVEDTLEYDTIVVGTATMPPDAWCRMCVLSWAAQLFYGLKVGVIRGDPLAWLDAQLTHPVWADLVSRWEAVAQGMQQGHGRAGQFPGLAGWWEQEELAFLTLATEGWTRLPPDQRALMPSVHDFHSFEAFARDVVVVGRKNGAVRRERRET